MGAKILIVDDDEDFNFLIEKVLEHAGHEGVFCETPECALEEFKKNECSLVLVDYTLGAINGVELVRQFRNLPDAASKTILLMSARDDIEELCKEAGANGFLPKPLPPKEFIQSISKYL